MSDDRPQSVSSVLPKEFFRNSIRLYYAEEAMQPMAIGALLAALAIITLLPSCMGTVSPERSHALLLAWGLWAIQGAFLFIMRWALDGRREQLFWLMTLFVGTLQGLWIQLLTWVHMDGAPAVATSLLFGLFVTWAFNDAKVAYDHPIIQASYVTSLVAFYPALLVVDAMGGVGLVGTWQQDMYAIRDWAFIQGVLMLCTQGILIFIGRSTYQLDLAAAQANEELRDQAVRDSERLVLQRASDVLAGELTTRRFSADVRSPVSLLQSGLDMLRIQRENPQEIQLLDEMDNAVAAIQAMAQRVSQTFQPSETTNRINSVKLVERAFNEAKLTLEKTHDVVMPRPVLNISDHPVIVATGHSHSVAGLLVNAALQHHGHNVQSPMRIDGRPINDWYYRFSLRDFGKPSEAAPAALQRVRARLGLRMSEAGPRSNKYQGMGMGLALAKLQIVRHGGWVDARLPDDGGRGIELIVVLPRVPHEAIPYEHASPERAADTYLAETSGVFVVPPLDAASYEARRSSH